MRYFLVGISGVISSLANFGFPSATMMSTIIGLEMNKFPTSKYLEQQASEYVKFNLHKYVSLEEGVNYEVSTEITSLTEVSETDYKTFFSEK